MQRDKVLEERTLFGIERRFHPISDQLAAPQTGVCVRIGQPTMHRGVWSVGIDA